MKIEELKIGATYTNGKTRERRLIGFDGIMALYKTKSKPNETTGIWISKFAKWAVSEVPK